MSWSINFVGKPSKVAEAVKAKGEEIGYLTEPEKTVKDRLVDAAIAALEGFADGHAVSVNMAGSQSVSGGVVQHNYASLKIEPLYGFLE